MAKAPTTASIENDASRTSMYMNPPIVPRLIASIFVVLFLGAKA